MLFTSSPLTPPIGVCFLRGVYMGAEGVSEGALRPFPEIQMLEDSVVTVLE